MVHRFLCFPLSLPVVATLVRSALLRSLRFAPSVRSVRSLRPFAPSVHSARLVPVLSLLATLPTVPSARLCSRCFVAFCFIFPSLAAP